MIISEVFYNAGSQWALNLVLASMILGIALDIKWQDFRDVVRMPKAIVTGLLAQFLALPAITTGLTLLVDLPAGVELGMILVASCPGGSISNFVTHLSKGNTALSISMTAAASALATIMLPINFVFYSSLNPVANELMTSINVDSSALFISLVWVLAIPLVIGLMVRNRWPAPAKLLHQLLKLTSLLALFSFIVVAIYQNQDAFLSNFKLIFVAVLAHNAIALALGFFAGKCSGLGIGDIKATTIEVGMQNSSLAIVIVFTQFDGQVGMALISAFWGTWHIASGLVIALVFSRWNDTSKGKE